MFKVLSDIMSIPELRRRIFVVFALLAVYRIGFHIYLPGVNIDALNDWLESAREDGGGTLFDFIQITSALTGGQLSNATIFSLGIMPYISASIIFSLLVKVFPKLEALQKEGDSGRQTINRYTRYSTVLLCIIQSLFVVKFLHTPLGRNIGTLSEGWEMACLQVLVLTAGTIFLMWLGEKMTEFGIGNGVSLIIMAGIIAAMPGGLLMLGDQVVNAPADEKPFEVLRVIILLVLFFLIVLGVVYITRGQRRIPVQQARTVKGRRVYGGQRHYMPIRVNSAGVLPIIFAQSLIMLPTGLVTFMAGQGNWFTDLFAYGSFAYMIVYVVMIGFFTYFWTSLMFNPVEMSQNMKEYGSFIPGIRPGRRTAEYLEAIINRITMAGAVFLSVIAVAPMILTQSLRVDFVISGFMGGTGILIVVGVALDLVDKVEAQLLVRHYEGFMKTGGRPGGGGGIAPTPGGDTGPAPTSPAAPSEENK